MPKLIETEQGEQVIYFISGWLNYNIEAKLTSESLPTEIIVLMETLENIETLVGCFTSLLNVACSTSFQELLAQKFPFHGSDENSGSMLERLNRYGQRDQIIESIIPGNH